MAQVGSPRSISRTCDVFLRRSPAENAPIIMAEPIASASQANPKANIRPTLVAMPGLRACGTISPEAEPAFLPSTRVRIRNPKASPVVLVTLPTVTAWPPAKPLTTAKIISPNTSSMTAAPKTIWLSVSWRRPRSESTRAVIPTLVAVSVAPATSDGRWSSPNTWHTPYPNANGTTTPTMATAVEAPPTLSSFARSVSSPISKRRMTTPSSDSRCGTSFLGFTTPKSDVPSKTPARSSPRTAGWPIRLAPAPSSFAEPRIRTTRPKNCGTVR